MLSAKAELANLNTEVTREINRIVENKELAYASAAEKVKLLEGQLQKLKDSVVKSGEYQVKLGEFKREIDVSQRPLRQPAAALQGDQLAGKNAGLRRTCHGLRLSAPASELPEKGPCPAPLEHGVAGTRPGLGCEARAPSSQAVHA